MNDQLIPVVSKQLKIINDINQVVKKSFLRYFIVRNGVVFTDDTGAAISSGNHFSFVEEVDKLVELIPIEEGTILMLDSAAVYTTIKDNKKVIKYIKIDEGKVYLSGDELNFHIGRILPLNDTARSTYQGVVDYIMKKNEDVIADEVIESLLNNEVVTFSEEEMKVRLTKALIPHLKIGNPTSITFMEVDDPNLFEIMLSITKDKITNFHVFKCIKY